MYADRDVANLNTEGLADSNVKQGWEAELCLGFVRRDEKTLLAKRSHRGPLTVQRPFYPEGGLCHVYLLHPPGGIVAGDHLSIDINVAEQAEALITTPAAGKFYRSAGDTAVQTVSLQLEHKAVLEWLPQETIIYEGARLQSTINVELSEDAGFIGWEILAFGRPAAGEGFNNGDATLNWRIFRNGKPLFLEKMQLDTKAFKARWGLNGNSVCGTLIASSATTEHLETVRNLIGDAPGLGVTLIDDLLICRACADKTGPVRSFFERVRNEIRTNILRRQHCAPRIWAT